MAPLDPQRLSIRDALDLFARVISISFGVTPVRITIDVHEDERPIVLPMKMQLHYDMPSNRIPSHEHAGDAPKHSPDFRAVHWSGQDYIFSPTQASVVRQLWEAWEDGNGEVGQETLLEKAGSESSRLRDLFKDHPAWGNVIKSCGKGVFSLNG